VSAENTDAGSAADALLLDELTALPNRRWIVGTLPGYFRQLRAAGASLSLVLLDIDGLAKVNARVGREEGDELLKTVAGKIAANCGSDAVAARYAGDEFLVLLPDTEEFFARIAAEELVSAVSGSVKVPGEEAAVSLSAGVASCPRDAGRLAGLFSAAKDALYLAKRRGRGTVVTAEDVEEAKPQELDPFSRFPCPRLVGRGSQPDSVIRACEAAAPGQGRLALVTGPGGVGKTRFLGEVAATLAESGRTVLQTACRGGEDLRAFSAAADLIENHVLAGSRTAEGVMRAMQPVGSAQVGRLVPSLASVAAEAPAPADEAAGRALTFKALLKILEGISHERILVLVIDDIDWADLASLELISAAARSPEVALTLVASHSGTQHPVSGDVPFDRWVGSAELARSALRVKLEPLGAPDVSAMIDAVLPGRAADAAADALVARLSGGLPLAVEELVKGCLASGEIERSGLFAATEGFTAKPGLDAVIDARAAALEATELAVAFVTGSAGGWADLSALEELTGRREGEVLEAVEHLMRQGLMRPTGGAGRVAFGFWSPVVSARCRVLAPVEVITDVQRMLKDDISSRVTFRVAPHLAYRLAVAGIPEQAEAIRSKLRARQRGLAEAAAPEAEEPRPHERPGSSTKELSEAAKAMMKPLMDVFVGAVREARNASARDTATLRVVSELISAFEEVLDEVGVLTLSSRQNAMRANGVLLGVRPYGDAPALVGGIMRRKGIDVISIDSSVKIDELIRLIHVLSQDVPPVATTDEYEGFLDRESIFHISIEPARLMPRNTEVPYLPEPPEAQTAATTGPPAIIFDGTEGGRKEVPTAADLEQKSDPFAIADGASTRSFPRGRLASYEAPTIMTERVDKEEAPARPEPPERPAPAPAPEKPERRRRRAIFETNVSLLPAGLATEPPTGAHEVAGAAPSAVDLSEVPEGDGPLELTPGLEKNIPDLLRQLAAANDLSHAAVIVKRLLMGFPLGDEAGRLRLANFLLRGIELFLRILDPELEKALERTLAKELAVEANAGTAEMLAECSRECIVRFVRRGSFHAAGHLARALRDAKAASARAVLAGLARTDVFDSLIADIESGDATRIQNAAVVLASMGIHSFKPLLEVIRLSDDYRVRAAAAFIVKETSAEGGPPGQLVSSMGPAAPPDERVRVISVADKLGLDVAEVVFEAMLDPEDEVRAAGLKLARRLDADAALAAASRLAEAGTPEALTGSFEMIGELEIVRGLEIIAEHLPESISPEAMAKGARALGRLARSAGVAQPKSVTLLQAVLAKCIAIATPEMTAAALEAVRALGEHDAPEASVILEAAAAFPDEAVASAAKRLREARN